MQRLSQIGFLVGIAALLCSLLASGDALAKGAKARSKGSSSSSHTEQESSSGGGIHISTSGLRPGSNGSAQSGTAGSGAAAAGGSAAALSPAALAATNAQSADFEARKAQYMLEKSNQGAPQLLGTAAASASTGTKTTATGSNIVTLPAGGAGQLFRITDAAGRVTFTDKVPNQAGMKVIEGLGAKALLAGGGDAFSNLPSALAGPVGKFPVMLYSTNNCTPCAQAREFLRSRGVPFQERSVRSPADVEALGRITGGDSTMPLLTVGGQQIKGYSDVEYAQTLDAAEYPKASVLPASFRFPAATSLTATAVAAAAGADGATEPGTAAAGTAAGLRDADGNALVLRGGRAPRSAPQATADTATQAPANPAGIRF